MFNILLLVLMILILASRIIILEKQIVDLENRLDLLEDESIDSMIKAYEKDKSKLHDI